VVANRDQTVGPGGIGMYLVASPTDNTLGTVGAVGGVGARQLWAAAHRGNTIISAGAPFNNNSGNVVFAPARQGANEGNAVLLAQRIVDSACASPHWATIGYDVPTSNTGARISVTNGHNTTAGRNGNLSVALNRRDNGAGFGTKEWALKLRSGQTDLVLTEDGAIRTTFAGANITTAGNISASTFLGNLSGTTATLSSTATITGNINLGTNAAINYDEVYGSFYKTANITAAAADTIYAFDWTANTSTVASNRVTISDTSRINIAKTGAYKTSVTFQIRNDDNALRTAFIWLRKNGTDVAGSTNRLGIQPKGSATASFQHQVLEWLTDVNGGDYLEVMFAVDNISGISLEYNDAQASPYVRPAIPSAVLVVKPVGA
jgi:hypothetical protein